MIIPNIHYSDHSFHHLHSILFFYQFYHQPSHHRHSASLHCLDRLGHSAKDHCRVPVLISAARCRRRGRSSRAAFVVVAIVAVDLLGLLEGQYHSAHQSNSTPAVVNSAATNHHHSKHQEDHRGHYLQLHHCLLNQQDLRTDSPTGGSSSTSRPAWPASA